MRHNIFDSIPSNIVSGKDSVFANFLQTAGLYDSMKEWLKELRCWKA